MQKGGPKTCDIFRPFFRGNHFMKDGTNARILNMISWNAFPFV